MALNGQCSSTESFSTNNVCFLQFVFCLQIDTVIVARLSGVLFFTIFDYPSDFNQCLIYFTGKMFPTEGHMYIAPFNDDALYQEQSMKPNFWCHQNFHGVDLTTLRMDSFEETFKQPIVVMCFH